MRLLYFFICTIFIYSCSGKMNADNLIYNATIYTVDSVFSIADAMVIRDNKIEAIGKKEELENKYNCKETTDANGQFIYPGFIDAHAHFIGYAQSLATCDLTGTKSWDEILDRLRKFATQHTEGWIQGRGWDQNDWQDQSFPVNDSLNHLFPDRPVYLTRIDGHAAIVNEKALAIAQIKPGQTIDGGTYEVKNNKLTGILIDNAMDAVAAKIPQMDEKRFSKVLSQAQENCFAVGLTTIHDCGLDYEVIDILDKLQHAGQLKMRIYALLSDSKKNYDYLLKKGIIKTSRLHVQGFKVYADGALGSRGACLLDDYQDRKGWKGFLLSNAAHFDSVAALIAANNWQMCTHAIGDSGNRVILQTYANYLKGANDRRWRIEHAQVVNEHDFTIFHQNSIIPSVQPTHATSDMYWAVDRLGTKRIKNAYAYQQLLKQNNWLPLGTDFPVEDISPFKTFYAAVVRKDADGYPENGFQMENALTREQALRGMTIWAAKAGFEEQEKGSLEPGKLADFIILDKDLMIIPEQELFSAKVLATYIAGEMVYKAP